MESPAGKIEIELSVIAVAVMAAVAAVAAVVKTEMLGSFDPCQNCNRK